MTFFKAPTYNYTSTTLNGSINDSVDTIVLNDASKLEAPGYVVIDREDGNGTGTPNSREVVYFATKDGNSLTGCTRAADNSTARSHSDGALVEAVLTVGMWNGLRDAVATALSTDGTGLAVSNATVSEVTQSARFVGTSIASISRMEMKQMALSSVATVATFYITTHLEASGASIVGFSSGTGGLNAVFQVPGSLASCADIGGRIVVPTGFTGTHMIGYSKTPSSIASISIQINKNYAEYGVLTILGGATHGSSASIGTAALVAGDILTMDIKSTASLAQDLSVVLRAS